MANDNDLIRRGDLKELLLMRSFFPAIVAAALKELPAVDADPVVYAHWEDEYGGMLANPRWRCSACKEKALYTFEVNSLGNEVEKQELSTRCPECGAHMYREGNEDGK